MKDFFSKLFAKPSVISSPTLYTGANIDARPPEAKQDDIHFSEIVGTANSVTWTKKDPSTYRKFSALNQGGTFQCGAYAGRKALGVAYSTYPQYGSYLDFSNSDIYKGRHADAGMAMWEIFAAWGRGVTLQALVNDNPKTDADTDSLVIPQWMHGVGANFATSGGVYLPNDIDMIASVIQTTGKAVILLTYFTGTEWSMYSPFIFDRSLEYGDLRAYRHFVVAVDFALDSFGNKMLIIEDSAWFGGINQRTITEDWVKNRVIQGGYPMNFKFAPAAGSRPTYDGGTTISLQACLRFDGEFPSNVQLIESFGPLTRKSLSAFQIKYGLEATGQLDPKTVGKLHQLFP